MPKNRWSDPDHALGYLGRADKIPHRGEGEAMLVSLLPARTDRVLDLGCGDGRLLALVKAARPEARGVALDSSPTMLGAARSRFAGDESVEVLDHDLDQALGDLGTFDAVVSSFAIHHLDDARKRSLAGEVKGLLRRGGAFLNLEHVASPSESLHHQFLAALSIDPQDDDPSNRLAPVELQLSWLRDLGYNDVDCLWKWREMALLAAVA